MKKYLNIAIRNLFRNKRRFAVTNASIVCSVIICSMLTAMIHSVQKEIRNSIAESQVGDVTVYHKGYPDSTFSFPLNLTIADTGEELGILKKSKYVKSMSSRIRFSGILSNGPISTIFAGIACDPKTMMATCPRFADYLAKGRFLSDSNSNEIVISECLAKSMKLSINDPVALMVKTRSGSMNAIQTKIGGTFNTLMMGEKHLIYCNLPMIRNLLDLDGQSTEIVVRVDDNEKLSNAKDKLLQEMKSKNLDVDILTWDQIVVFFKNVMGVQDLFVIIIFIILFILTTTTIVNTILMTVYERLKEIGLMKALGVKRKQVYLLFIIEGGLYGVFGGVIGCTIAWIIMYVIQIKGGIVFTFPMHLGATKPWLLFPNVSNLFRLFMVLYAILAGIVASLYPASKASKMNVLDILRNRILYSK